MAKKRTVRNVNVTPESLVEGKTDNQVKLIKGINHNTLTLCSGCAGTGKTYITSGLACEHLLNKKVKKIIVSRSTQQCGNSGFLPGDIDAKLMPFMNPIVAKMEFFLGPDVYKKMILDKVIEIYPLETMRGESLDDCFMILTEFQNATYEQIMMFVTRIGQNTKCVIEGDLLQIDNPKSGGKKFWDIQSRSEGLNQDIAFCKLDESDIQRSGILKTLIDNERIYYKMKEREM